MESLAPKIAEFGVGIFAIGTISYIFWTFLKTHKEEIEASRVERIDNQKWFMEFVNVNNHQKEELIKSHTEVLVQVKGALENVDRSIQNNTEQSRILVQTVLKK